MKQLNRRILAVGSDGTIYRATSTTARPRSEPLRDESTASVLRALKTDLTSGAILGNLFKPFSVANSDGQALGDGIGNRLA